MKSLFILFLGIFIGLWSSWLGMVKANNWKCFKRIIIKSIKEQISFRANLAVLPNYLLKRKNNERISILRVVSDTCF